LTKVIERVKYHLHRYFVENKTSEGYCVKLDIRHYFNSTSRRILKEKVLKTVKEPHFCEHVCKIIDSFDDPRPKAEIEADPFGSRGIGLGSQCS